MGVGDPPFAKLREAWGTPRDWEGAGGACILIPIYVSS